MIRKMTTLVMTLAILGTSGCKSPQKIRNFSQLQATHQRAFRDSMREYFQASLDLAKQVAEKSKSNVVSLSKENVELLKDQAAEDLGSLKELKDRKARLDALTREIQEQAEVKQISIEKIDKDYDLIQGKTQELIDALDALVEAQDALNTYLHTKSIDEKLLGNLQDLVSQKLNAVNQLSKEIISVFNGLQKELKWKKKSSHWDA